MKRRRDIPLPKIGDELNDDTDEMELSPEQAHALSLATDVDHPESSTTAELKVITAAPLSPPEQSRRDASASSDRWRQLRIAGFLGTAAAVIAVGSLGRCTATRNPPADQLTVNPLHHDVPAVSTTPVGPAASITPSALAAPTTPAPAPPATAPIRIRNAFDRSEVFEFPAGTSEAEARASVADMLLQRARERQ